MRAIEEATGRTIGSKSLLFLDEVQVTPRALQALRFFFEELPDLPIIAAGSLLELVLPDIEFSMPVSRIENFYLGSCSFSEFLFASLWRVSAKDSQHRNSGGVL